MLMQYAYAVGMRLGLEQAAAQARENTRLHIESTRKTKQKAAMLRCWRELGLIT